MQKTRILDHGCRTNPRTSGPAPPYVAVVPFLRLCCMRLLMRQKSFKISKNQQRKKEKENKSAFFFASKLEPTSSSVLSKCSTNWSSIATNLSRPHCCSRASGRPRYISRYISRWGLSVFLCVSLQLRRPAPGGA